jgi:predicted thioesterase
MKEEDEEGIGTRLDIQHVSPALLGSEVDFTATFEEISEKGEIMTSFEARVGERLIAKGIQGQRILKREKIDSIFRQLKG